MNEAETRAGHIDPGSDVAQAFAGFQKYLYADRVA